MRKSSLKLLALNNIGPKDRETVNVANTTLCLYDENQGQFMVSVDRSIMTDLPKGYRVVVGAVANENKIIAGVDVRLKFDAEVASKMGDGLTETYGAKINLDTAAIDTKFDTKLVRLERDGDTWKYKENDAFRSFEVDRDGKFALIDPNGGLSYDISFKKTIDLVEGKDAFKPKVTFAAGSRLVPGVPGTKFGVYDPNKKMMHYLDYEGNFISGEAAVIPVKAKDGDGYATVCRDEDGAVSMIGKIGDISEAFKVGGDFYKKLTVAANMAGDAHKAPAGMANAK